MVAAWLLGAAAVLAYLWVTCSLLAFSQVYGRGKGR